MKLRKYFFSNQDTDSINAEALFAKFLIEHSLPLSFGDHARPLFRKMFTDSAIAKKYGCGRTKTGAIVQSTDNTT